ncbi:type II toxin-antitoxin system VapC family toxin [Pollutimonas bauzanensis]|uniref:PIN domain-containing protein n=1 Tax=Pollutimonas bauzanensis TaxID=658167 RepID=A0A1M5VGB5_9BURK|nr:type II toxin-antitoxin system VapC family toxin [Pollutimonas bauzanensis]SHH74144.1 hypothetical protein SAMN04488135_104369 [Pollutimonas bauzanensis]
MSYLVDTNVLSELRRKMPDPGVLQRFEDRPASTLFLSVWTLGEIRKGAEAISQVDRRQVLVDWLETELTAFFTGRILAVDVAVADRWSRLVAGAGRPLPAIHSMLAATALEHDLILVARNTKDFESLGVSPINPWNTGLG